MLEIRMIREMNEKELARVDAFIMGRETNGEFINTVRYLSYHGNRFEEDSIVVLDKKSQMIRGLMFATVNQHSQVVTSHAGTTFAGPVISRKLNIALIEEVLEQMLGYYENKYKKVELKLQPAYYAFQPNNSIDYFLLKRGYTYSMTALANIIHISQIHTIEDALLLCWSKRRSQIKRALQEDMFLFREKSLDRIVWEHMNQNLEHKFQSRSTHTLDEMRELMKRFPDNIKAFYMETRTKAYGAFALVYCFKNVFHTQYLDLNYNFASHMPNLLLILRLIMKARDMGYDYLSFGSSTENRGSVLNYGLYQYKAEYGGGDIILPLYTKEKND